MKRRSYLLERSVWRVQYLIPWTGRQGLFSRVPNGSFWTGGIVKILQCNLKACTVVLPCNVAYGMGYASVRLLWFFLNRRFAFVPSSWTMPCILPMPQSRHLKKYHLAPRDLLWKGASPPAHMQVFTWPCSMPLLDMVAIFLLPPEPASKHKAHRPHPFDT